MLYSMIRITNALHQISEIHRHLTKGEIYRGFRSAPVALSGLCGLVAAVVQPRVAPPAATHQQVLFWISVAVIAGAIGGSEIGFNYLFRADRLSRQATRRLLVQFLPCLVVGAAATSAALRIGDEMTRFLPGLWSSLFGLGILATLPYQPRSSRWVALFYIGMGLTFLVFGLEPSYFGWKVGLTFGLGQMGAAAVLYWNLERSDHE